MNATLPTAAKMKLVELQGAAQDAADAAASAQRHIADIDRAAAAGEPSELTLAELKRHRAQRDHQSNRHRELAGLVAHVSTFMQSHRTAVFEHGRVAPVQLQDGETVQQAVARVREAIRAAKAELTLVDAAPLPRAHLIARARKHVDALAERGRPKIGYDRKTGEFTVELISDAYGPSSNRIIPVLAWFDREKLLARITAQINALPEPKLALSPDAKRERVASIKASIDAMERQEEALINRAASEGVEILRRPNASPLAVLGIRHAKAMTAQRKEAATA